MSSSALLIALLAAAALFALGAGAIAFVLYRLLASGKNKGDGTADILQKEIASLRSQFAENLAQTAQALNQQIHNLSGALGQNLQATSGQIHSRLDSYSKVVQEVSSQLGSLSEATKQIFEATKTISTLEEILKPPKLRGSMGEILLENILREILPSQDFFTLQHSFRSGNTVDAVIRLREGVIPVDAKFPLDNFRRMLEAGDEKERAALRREFIKNVKKHIDAIAEKYILPDEGTLNFALMYVPAENVYYEMIIKSEAEDLYSYSTKKHVFPVSPNSIYPYLMTLALGFRGLKIEAKAKEILGELIRLQGELQRFTGDFELVGTHISNAQKKFGEAEKRLGQMDRHLLRLKEGSPEDPAPVRLEELP